MSAGLHSKWNRTLTWMLSAALIAQGGTVVYAGDLGDEAAVEAFSEDNYEADDAASDNFSFGFFAAYTYREIGRTCTWIFIFAEDRLDNTILQRMECDNTDSASVIEKVDHSIQ